MKNFMLATTFLLMSSTPAFARTISSGEALNVLIDCSVRVTNASRSSVLYHSVGALLGNTPAIFENYCVPAFKSAGTTPPKFSLLKWQYLAPVSLSTLAIEISQHSR